jgi:hypothetical protein
VETEDFGVEEDVPIVLERPMTAPSEQGPFFFLKKLDEGSPTDMKREDSEEGEFEGLDADADSLEPEEEDLAAEAEEDRLQDLREYEEMLERQELLQAQEDELVELEDARLAEQS